MDATDLAEYVAAPDAGGFVGECWNQAAALVATFIGECDVPEIVKDRAVLEVGAELYNRKEAPNGIMQFGDLTGGQGVRVARNPMVAAYPLLTPYVGGGIG